MAVLSNYWPTCVPVSAEGGLAVLEMGWASASITWTLPLDFTPVQVIHDMVFDLSIWPQGNNLPGIKYASTHLFHKSSSRLMHQTWWYMKPIASIRLLKHFWGKLVIYLCIDLHIFTRVTCRIIKIDNLDQNFKRNAVIRAMTFVFS